MSVLLISTRLKRIQLSFGIFQGAEAGRRRIVRKRRRELGMRGMRDCLLADRRHLNKD